MTDSTIHDPDGEDVIAALAAEHEREEREQAEYTATAAAAGYHALSLSCERGDHGGCQTAAACTCTCHGDRPSTIHDNCGHLRDGGVCIECAVPEPKPVSTIHEGQTAHFIDVVFDGPPSHESGRFVEVEDEQGASINAGTWIEDGDLWRLRIQPLSARVEELERLNGKLLGALREAEWGGTDMAAPAEQQAHCPVCSNDRETGHWENCLLGNLLVQHSNGGN